MIIEKWEVHDRIKQTLLELNNLKDRKDLQDSMDYSQLTWVITNFTSGNVSGFYGTSYAWSHDNGKVNLLIKQS